MKKVISVDFNWRQVGSVQDKNGAGEDYERITVGDRRYCFYRGTDI